MDKKRKDHFWQAAVVVLIVFLFIQSGVLIYMLNGKKYIREDVKVRDDAVLVPRCIQSPGQNRVSQSSLPIRSITSTNSSVQNKRCTGCSSGCVGASSGSSIKNILAPLPNIGSSTGSSHVNQVSPALQPQCSNGGISGFSTTSIPSGVSGSMMQAMMNDPFFDDDSFFGDIHEEFARMQKLMDSMFPNSGKSSVSMSIPGAGFRSMSAGSSGIKDDGKNYIVELKVPGLDKSALKAKIEGNILTVSGVKKEEVRNAGQYGSSYSSSYSSFQNSFSLPGQVDSKNVTIDYKNGILKVILPKV